MARYITPAVTPMYNGEIDLASAEKLYEHLIGGGVDGVLVFGSIGEFYAFTAEQKKELIRRAVKTVAGRVELIVGTSSMVYEEIVELSRFALDAGADAVMVLPPYYFPHTQRSIFDYYKRLSEDIGGRLYIYNFPDRTGYSVAPETMARLAQACANIVGVKDTIGGVDHTREIIKAVKPLRPDFAVYSGFDDNFLHNVSCGGDGCVSGISNIYPKLTSAWVAAANAGDLNKAAEIQRKIDRLMDIYAVGTPFVPYIKEALRLCGVIRSSEARFPMPTVSEEESRRVREIMEAFEK